MSWGLLSWDRFHQDAANAGSRVANRLKASKKNNKARHWIAAIIHRTPYRMNAATGFETMFPGLDCRGVTLPWNFKLPFIREVRPTPLKPTTWIPGQERGAAQGNAAVPARPALPRASAQ